MEEIFRTDCAAGKISTTFEANTPSFAARVRTRNNRVRTRNNRAFELSCFWCGGKGYTLFECPDPPPNAKSKAARDMVATAKENKNNRFQRAEARRLAPAATNAFVTDDEESELEED